MKRVIKKGRALSAPFSVFNGFGQGDVMSLLPALLVVSWHKALFRSFVKRLALTESVEDGEGGTECSALFDDTLHVGV